MCNIRFDIQENSMKLLIAGSRGIKNFDLEKYVPEEVTLIISGGAAGIDALAEEYADKKHISKLILHPEYNKWGKFAPLKRNELMIELCDAALIVWDGHSRGTQYTLSYANKMGKKVILVTNTAEL